MITATGPRYEVTHTIITNELLFDEILNQIDRLTLDNATDKGFALAAPVWYPDTEAYYLFVMWGPRREILGYAFVSVFPVVNRRHPQSLGVRYWLEGLEVHRNYRRRGYGRHILRIICDAIPQTLFVHTPSKSVRFFYMCNGWSAADKETDIYQSRSVFFFPKSFIRCQRDYDQELAGTGFGGAKGYELSEMLFWVI